MGHCRDSLPFSDSPKGAPAAGPAVLLPAPLLLWALFPETRGQWPEGLSNFSVFLGSWPVVCNTGGRTLLGVGVAHLLSRLGADPRTTSTSVCGL